MPTCNKNSSARPTFHGFVIAPVLPRFRPRFSLWPYFTLCSLLFPVACVCRFRGLRTFLSTVGYLILHTCMGSRVGW